MVCPVRSRRRLSRAQPRSCRSRPRSWPAPARASPRREKKIPAVDDLKQENLKQKTDDQLQQQLGDLKREQFNLRFQSATNQLEKPSRVRVVRRTIARIRTLQNERARTAGAK